MHYACKNFHTCLWLPNPCSLNIKDLLRAVDGLMMLIMDGGYYGRWRVGNRLRVPLPGRWGWCQPRPDSARVLKGRMQLVKAIAAVKGRSNKSLKVKWHTIWRGKTVYILPDITTMFKRVFVLFLAKSYCWLRLGRKAHRADQCPLMPLREFKAKSWTMATEGRAEQEDKWDQSTCQLAAQVSG